MRDVLDYLDALVGEAESYWTMWDCVEREEFVDAMHYHLLTLYYHDRAVTLMEDFDDDGNDLLMAISKATYGDVK